MPAMNEPRKLVYVKFTDGEFMNASDDIEITMYPWGYHTERSDAYVEIFNRKKNFAGVFPWHLIAECHYVRTN